jgi:signal peptidase I
VAATASESGERRARLRGPSRRTAGRVGTFVVLAAAMACALLVWPGFLRGGTAYVIVSGQSMEPTLHAGDLVLTVRHRTYDIGEVVAYRIPEGQPGAGVLVIHRIVAGSASSGYTTQGDNRDGRDPWRPRPQDIVGAEGLSVPRVGLALAYLRTPLGLAGLAGIVTILLILGGSSTKGAPESSAAKRTLGARLGRRDRRDGSVGTEDFPDGSAESTAEDAPAAVPLGTAAGGSEETGNPGVAGAVAAVGLLLAVTLLARRHL